MDAHRVDILHRAHRDHVACGVPHGFKFDLFPACDAFFHQHLADRRQIQPGSRDSREFLRVFGNAAASSAQRIGRTDDDWIADLLGNAQRFLHGHGRRRRDHRLPHLLQRLPEAFPVLRPLDALQVRTQQAHAVFFQGSVPAQLHGQRQARLSAESRQQAVRALLLDDAPQGFPCQGFEVDGIRQLFVGHDGGRVGVDQHSLDSLLLQDAAGLRSGIVELGRLPDDDRARADDEYLLNAVVSRHFRPPLRASCAGTGQTGIPYRGGPHRPPDETGP